MRGVTIRAQVSPVMELARAVREACGGEVDVSARELIFEQRVEVVLRPRGRRPRSRGWRARMLALATSCAAGRAPANVMVDVRWR